MILGSVMMDEQDAVGTQSRSGRPPAGDKERQEDLQQVRGWRAALDAERLQIATRILPVVIGLAVISELGFIAVYFILGRPWQWIWMVLEVAGAILFFLLAYLAARKGRLSLTVYLTTVGIVITTVIGPALIEGIAVAGVASGMIAIIFARLLAGRTQNRVVVATTAVATGAGVLLAGFRVFALLSVPSWVYTLTNVVTVDLAILIIAMILDSRDVRYENALAQAEAYSAQLEAQRAMLEQRGRDLARRARYQEAAATVARDAAAMLDLPTLLSRVVTLISEQLGFYHTGIFLLDPAREWAVLQAASSEGGQRMLQRGHRLRLGTGIVGYVAAQEEPRIALDVGEDAVFFDNPDLPETRSELALPLRTRGELIGVLDVQSQEPAAFSQQDVAVLQILADQVAVAISNARLFQQAQESLEAERRAYGELTRRAWEELLQTLPVRGYRYYKQTVAPVNHLTEEGQPSDEELPQLKLPIQYRGQKLGTLVARKPADSEGWTSAEVELMKTLAERVGVALDSARLYEDSQRRATRERLMAEITARIRTSIQVETVLRTAVQELGQALGATEGLIWLAAEEG